jgi:hypothetical protein
MYNSSFRVDGGASCHVATNPTYFIHLIHKKVPVKLGVGEKGSLDGVGIAAVVSEQQYIHHVTSFLFKRR